MSYLECPRCGCFEGRGRYCDDNNCPCHGDDKPTYEQLEAQITRLREALERMSVYHTDQCESLIAPQGIYPCTCGKRDADAALAAISSEPTPCENCERLHEALQVVQGKIDQYCRLDFYMWLMSDPNGLKYDPCKRAQEASIHINAALAASAQPIAKPEER